MLRLLFKLVIICAVAVAIFYAFRIGMAYRFASLTASCASPENAALASDTSKSTAERWKGSQPVYSCVRQKQNFFDRLFFKIPERWTDPAPP